VDVQGASVVRPYVEKAGATFPVFVDTSDIFGHAYDLNAIPVTYLVDEAGIIRLRGGGPTRQLLEQIKTVLNEPLTAVRGIPSALPAALSKAELQRSAAMNTNDWRVGLALAQRLADEGRAEDALIECARVAAIQPREADVYFIWGTLLLQQNQKTAALTKLKQARDLAPNNWRIRKQIWALEHPDKFYNNASPDFNWQKEQLAREKKFP
jgi:tetratricopeptide (TPR) repeat protein